MPATESPPVEASNGPLVVVTYSHRDREAMDRVLSYLSPDFNVRIYRDEVGDLPTNIESLYGNLAEAVVLVILISPEHLHSGWITTDQSHVAEQLVGSGKLKLVSLLLRESPWQEVPLLQLQAVMVNLLETGDGLEREEKFEQAAFQIEQLLALPVKGSPESSKADSPEHTA